MKQIVIQNFKEPRNDSHLTRDKLFTVHLGNHRFIRFKGKRNCITFLAETNRVLNEAMQNINQIYGEVFVIFRDAWLSMSTTDRVEDTVQMKLDSVAKLLNKSCELCKHTNGNTYAFTSLMSSCTILIEVLDFLSKFYVDKKHHMPLQKLRYIKFQLEIIKNTLENHGIGCGDQ